MMSEEIIFRVIDPLGNSVILTTARYEDHIKYRHPELSAVDIKNSIQCPEYIIMDNHRKGHNDYYAHSCYEYPQHYVKTSVDINSMTIAGYAKVVTAHLTEEVSPMPSKSEDILYDRKKDEN